MRIAIIGAGLTGLLLSLYLARRGYEVDIYEQRSDPRITTHPYDKGRKMSIDLSSRGLLSLAEMGLAEKILSKSVPMRDRVIHLPNGEVISLAYGKCANDCIHTVSRSQLHFDLLQETESVPSIVVHFNRSFVDMDTTSGEFILFDNHLNKHFNIKPFFLFGCDGANSMVRKCIEKQKDVTFQYSYFPYQYKELTIPYLENKTLQLEAMHMWPRENSMLVAQPNYDHSFTCAFLLPSTGDYSFEKLTKSYSPQQMLNYFKDQYSDIYPFISNLENDLYNNPIGSLITINEGHWNIDKVALMGDSTHAMVPFLGQGLNCCFEDCYLFNQFLDKYNDDWQTAIPAFEEFRKKDTNAITIMSLENYPELFDSDLQKSILLREIENYLMVNFKDTFATYHNLTCFSSHSYSYINSIRLIQKEMILDISQTINNIKEINKDKIELFLEDYHKKICKVRIQ
ncbi:FAD-dependent oxidoreductase [Legionella longbeachae]|uniref:FAD-dependent oxidoreductase n=1 Tax=Legionella longbeachae TaxID=450 RepID=UPI0012440625|nr:FAD-dependent monooxygenase [Legionella longbeachae]QEY51878.1 FAD-dependent monooxygenase [Legionella longbeachae]